jgi:2,3-bisphosphoglycerate-independent phosphoglycerate mutase
LDAQVWSKLAEPSDSKIMLLVLDGLGGLPMEPGGPTELEAATTPHLDQLAQEGICGLHESVAAGITPGSGPSHLALFGYDPLKYQVGRGVLSALGIDFALTNQDVAARGNFCTLDDEGRVADRRAGRISTEKNIELCKLLREIELPDVELFIQPVKEYRLLLVMRGEGLSGEISDTDPQDVGERPLTPRALQPDAEKSRDLVTQFLSQAREILSDRHPANMVLLRGFSQKPDWPSMEEKYGLQAAAIAAYPMYRGVAKLVGMEILKTGQSVEEEFSTLAEHWNEFDFFFLHVKRIDSAGEDGDFDRKVALIEEVDREIPRIRELKPDVLVVTGDHSTPALLSYHSWHPVPVLLWSEYARSDAVSRFGERACMLGGLGPRIAANLLMPLAMANARRLQKYGA